MSIDSSLRTNDDKKKVGMTDKIENKKIADINNAIEDDNKNIKPVAKLLNL